MTEQLTLEDDRTAGDAAMAQVAENAGETFMERAPRFVLDLLRDIAVAGLADRSGEEITDACKRAGIRPHDDRAFGAVYASLARRGLIERVGFCARTKGHGAAGGAIWRLKQ